MFPAAPLSSFRAARCRLSVPPLPLVYRRRFPCCAVLFFLFMPSVAFLCVAGWGFRKIRRIFISSGREQAAVRCGVAVHRCDRRRRMTASVFPASSLCVFVSFACHLHALPLPGQNKSRRPERVCGGAHRYVPRRTAAPVSGRSDGCSCGGAAGENHFLEKYLSSNPAKARP